VPKAGEKALEAENEKSQGRFLGVRLRRGGQVYFFPGEGLAVRPGDHVLVETEQGPTLGTVDSVLPGDANPPPGDEGNVLPGVLAGIAAADDLARDAENSVLAAEAAAFCKSCIKRRNLDMKLVDVDVLHNRSKIIFYFTAPSRIDFRELVKDLVHTYRTRIELRQIGVRHETQMVGALGNCGMVCCCHRYLRKFAPVTIRMAKEQNLFLNPVKLSGICGRLLCCLSFEQENYEEFNRRCPKPGKKYATGAGLVKILRVNMLSRSIAVLSEEGEEKEFSLEEWESLKPQRAEGPDTTPPRRADARRNEADDAGGLPENGGAGGQDKAKRMRANTKSMDADTDAAENIGDTAHERGHETP
jgi:cell fate regulator YaaT (PSP1 superfamily)